MTKPSTLRQRPPKFSSSKSATTPAEENSTTQPSPRGSSISLLDILRVLTTLLALSLSLSYYLTSGDSFTFNYRPWFTRLDQLKAYAHGPLLLTAQELSLYNGTSAPPDHLLLRSIPILLALNATIFDVSRSPHLYGPGGSYHVLAGRDATRAFVTGCFAEEEGEDEEGGGKSSLTGDLRGVERMFVPVEDVDVDVDELEEEDEEEARRRRRRRERKVRAEREMREARERVKGEVERWLSFYRGGGPGGKYFEVGRVVSEEEEEEGGQADESGTTYTGPVPKLCEAAERGRPRRSQLLAEIERGEGEKKPIFQPRMDGMGKPV